jgi:hypothetical protein
LVTDLSEAAGTLTRIWMVGKELPPATDVVLVQVTVVVPLQFQPVSVPKLLTA